MSQPGPTVVSAASPGAGGLRGSESPNTLAACSATADWGTSTVSADAALPEAPAGSPIMAVSPTPEPGRAGVVPSAGRWCAQAAIQGSARRGRSLFNAFSPV